MAKFVVIYEYAFRDGNSDALSFIHTKPVVVEADSPEMLVEKLNEARPTGDMAAAQPDETAVRQILPWPVASETSQ